MFSLMASLLFLDLKALTINKDTYQGFVKLTSSLSSTHVEWPSFLLALKIFFNKAIGDRISKKKILRTILELISPKNFPNFIQESENRIASFSNENKTMPRTSVPKNK